MPNSLVDTLQFIGRSRSWRALQEMAEAALPHADLSFALAGEDLYLRSIFKRRVSMQGTYVDIGCAAPISASNSYLFYSLGWRGICIDPNPDFAQKWAQYRPQDIYLACAVGGMEGPCFFFKHLSNQGMSEIKSTADPIGNDFAAPVPMTMRRLDSIFAEHLNGKKIQFMSIDVEGSGLSVLRSNDWKRYRPEIVVMECLTLSLDSPLSNPSIAFLSEQGYGMIGAMGTNVFLVSIGDGV